MKVYFGQIDKIVGDILDLTLWEWIDGVYEGNSFSITINSKNPNVDLRGYAPTIGSKLKIRIWKNNNVDGLDIFVYKN